MRTQSSLRGLFFSILLCSAACVVAGTLETEFTAAVVKDLPIGHRAPIPGPGGTPYAIRNNSDKPVEIRFSAVKPFRQQERSRRSHADVPDPSWLTVNPASLTLLAGKEGPVELYLAVPNDKQYANQKYEVWLLAQTQGNQVGVGLITRIQFNTVEKPVAPAREESPAPGSTTGVATNRATEAASVQPKEK